MKQTKQTKLYTLAEACELLSISTATGRNWVKSGRLPAVTGPSSKPPVFEERSLFALKEALASNKVSGLKSRRNKSYINGNLPACDDISLRCRLRHCAEQLILSAGYQNYSLYESFLNNLVDVKEYFAWLSALPERIQKKYTYTAKEDTLGLLYQSLCAMGSRKSSGSYYTSARLAKKLVEKHLPVLSPDHTVFDPSCGTGIFLLQLPDHIPLQNIYGNDINSISVTLTQINLALRYHITTTQEAELLKQNITVSDFLTGHDRSYDVIVGNPPWGAKLSAKEKENYRTRFSCATGNSIEIYDLFMEQSINHLTPDGILSFVLPEAILTVKSHTPVREFLLQNSSVRSVEYLGEAFEQVHCPSIILAVEKSTSRPFYKERNLSADCFSFSLTDKEYNLLQKISTCPNKTTLTGHSDFALGIVTGNNAELLHNAPAKGLEPIIKGSDISKYHIHSVSGYVAFHPEKFQQTAPEALYRAPEKLFYRFINKRLIFAYDNAGLLSLNSCNIVIPQIPGLSVKYILAILNSSVAQFFFEKKFHSVKVLRSHLEQIPIPMADAVTQKEIIKLVDKLMLSDNNSQEFGKLYSSLDCRIAELYYLTAEEYKIICN